MSSLLDKVKANLILTHDADDELLQRLIDVILCGTDRFEIMSVEDVKGRGMYLEVLAKKVTPDG